MPDPPYPCPARGCAFDNGRSLDGGGLRLSALCPALQVPSPGGTPVRRIQQQPVRSFVRPWPLDPWISKQEQAWTAARLLSSVRVCLCPGC